MYYWLQEKRCYESYIVKHSFICTSKLILVYAPTAEYCIKKHARLLCIKCQIYLRPRSCARWYAVKVYSNTIFKTRTRSQTQFSIFEHSFQRFYCKRDIESFLYIGGPCWQSTNFLPTISTVHALPGITAQLHDASTTVV